MAVSTGEPFLSRPEEAVIEFFSSLLEDLVSVVNGREGLAAVGRRS